MQVYQSEKVYSAVTNSLFALLFCSLSFMLFSCAAKEQPAPLYTSSITEGFANTRNNLQNQTKSVYAMLKEKATDPHMADKALEWLPKALLIGDISCRLSTYIDSLINGLDTSGALNNNAALFSKLAKYRQDILAVDGEINSVFSKRILLVNKAFDEGEKSGDQELDALFKSGLRQEKYVLLKTIQNNIAINENNLVTFCDVQTNYIHDHFDVSSLLIGQNSTHFKAGEQLIISAGIGSYSVASNPAVTVNGKTVAVENSVATYKAKVAGKAGKYTLPLTIEYLDRDGIKVKRQEEVVYYIDD